MNIVLEVEKDFLRVKDLKIIEQTVGAFATTTDNISCSNDVVTAYFNTKGLNVELLQDDVEHDIILLFKDKNEYKKKGDETLTVLI